MYRRILVAGFVFVMLLYGQVTLLPTQVLAGPYDPHTVYLKLGTVEKIDVGGSMAMNSGHQ